MLYIQEKKMLIEPLNSSHNKISVEKIPNEIHSDVKETQPLCSECLDNLLLSSIKK